MFDRDEFLHDDVRKAFALAKKHGIRIAYSNQAFELWYVLHFVYLDAALDRNQFAEQLGRFLGRKYGKNAPDLYETLLARQPDALRSAQRLMDYWQGFDPILNDPVTTVPDLVKELNKWRS